MPAKLPRVEGTIQLRGKYHAKLRINERIRQHYGGKDVFQKSLKTSDPRTAEKEVRALRTIMDAQIDKERATEGIEALARNLPPDQRSLLDGAGGVEGLKEQFERGKLRAIVVETLGGRIAEDASDPETRASRLSSFRAEAETIRAQANARGRVLRKIGVDVELANDVYSPRDVVEKWAHTIDPQTADAARYYVRRFSEFHGEIDVRKLTKSQLREFIEAIRQLPKHTSGKTQDGTFIRDLQFHDAVKWAKANQRETLSDDTREKYLALLKRSMSFAAEQYYRQDNPWASYKLRKSKQKHSAMTGRERRSFTPDEVRTILDHVTQSNLPGFGRGTIDFWAPWIAAHHGTRLQEVCQLRVCDFAEKDGVWSMQITDEGDDMRAKSASSIRWVPVHPKLISIGLKDHIASRTVSAAPEALAFPQWGYRSKKLESLPKDGRGRVSSAYGKRFGAMLRETLGITDKAVVFHSFRHRLQDAADNAGLPDAHRRYLTGRANEDTAEGGYGDGAAMPHLLRSLEQIDPLAP